MKITNLIGAIAILATVLTANAWAGEGSPCVHEGVNTDPNCLGSSLICVSRDVYFQNCQVVPSSLNFNLCVKRAALNSDCCSKKNTTICEKDLVCVEGSCATADGNNKIYPNPFSKNDNPCISSNRISALVSPDTANSAPIITVTILDEAGRALGAMIPIYSKDKCATGGGYHVNLSSVNFQSNVTPVIFVVNIANSSEKIVIKGIKKKD
ncbi:MAG: hypothetical protein WCQ53_05455 [bacterium]